MKKKQVEMTTINIKGKQVEIEKQNLLKYEIAEEIGVIDKVIESGWKSLTAKETGRIGGIMACRRKMTK